MKGIYALVLLLVGVTANEDPLLSLREGGRDLQSTLFLSTILQDAVVPGCSTNFTKLDTTITRDAQSSTISFDVEFSFQEAFDVCQQALPDLNITNPATGEPLFLPAQNVSLVDTVVAVSGFSLVFETLAIGFIVPNALVVPSFAECVASISVTPSAEISPLVGGIVASGFPSQICANLIPALADFQAIVSDNEFINTFPGRFPPSDIETQIGLGNTNALAVLGAIFGADNTFEVVDTERVSETFGVVRDSFLVAPAVSDIIVNVALLQGVVADIQEDGVAALAGDAALVIFTAIPELFRVATGEDFFEVVISQEQLGEIVGIAFGLVGVNDQTVLISSLIQVIEILAGPVSEDVEEILGVVAVLVIEGLGSGDFLEFARTNVTLIQGLIDDPQLAGAVPFIIDAFIQFQEDMLIGPLLSNPVISSLLPLNEDLITLAVFVQSIMDAAPEDLQQLLFLNAESVSDALGIAQSSYFEILTVAFEVLESNNTLDALMEGFAGLSDQGRTDLFTSVTTVITLILEPFLGFAIDDDFEGNGTSPYYYGNYSGYYGNYTGYYGNYSGYYDNNTTEYYYEGGFDFGSLTQIFTVGGLSELIDSPFFTDLFSIADPDTSILDFQEVLLATNMGTIKAAFSENEIATGVFAIIEERFPDPIAGVIPPFDFVPFGIILEQFTAEAAVDSTSDFEFELATFLEGALFEIIDFLFSSFTLADIEFPANFTAPTNLLSTQLGVDGNVIRIPFSDLGSDFVIPDLRFALNVTFGDFTRFENAFIFPKLDFSFDNFFFAIEFLGQRLEIDSFLSIAAEQALLLFVDYTTIAEFGFGNIVTLSDFEPVVRDFVDCSLSTVAASVNAQNVIASFEILSNFVVGNFTDSLLIPAEYYAYFEQIGFPFERQFEEGSDLTEGAIEDLTAEFLFLYSPALPTAIELAPKLLPAEIPILVELNGSPACARNPFFVPAEETDGEETDDESETEDEGEDDDESLPIEIIAGAGAAGVLAAVVAGYFAFAGGAVATAGAVGAGAAVAAGGAGAEGAAAGGAAGAEKADADGAVAGKSI